VDIEQRAQLGVRGFLGRAHMAPPSAVHQHINPPVPVDHVMDGRFDRCCVRYVQRECFDLARMRPGDVG
jgi:hypothetical protein